MDEHVNKMMCLMNERALHTQTFKRINRKKIGCFIELVGYYLVEFGILYLNVVVNAYFFNFFDAFLNEY